MQKIILFIEPCDDAFDTPEKIGHLFMNRFSVGEDTAFEVLNVLELGKASGTRKISFRLDVEYYEKEKGKGLMHIVYILELNCIFII